MKIAQVNSYFHPFMIGGAEWYVFNVSRELVKLGHDVTVFTSRTYRGSAAPSEETLDGIKVKRLPLKVDWSYRIKLWDGLRESLRTGGFDVIHTYDYAQMHSIDALQAARQSGAPSAITVFDVHSAIPRVWYKRYPMKVMDSYMAQRTFPLATRILVRAPHLVPDLPRLEGHEEKIRVSPSGVRAETFSEYDGGAFRRKHSIEGSPVVLFLGRLNPLKGPQLLLEAAPGLVKEFPAIVFVFVGPDQSGYRSYLEGLARKLGVSSSVRFTGMIEDFDEKMRAYAACDVLALPTTYEGTSQAIFEAMAQGKPIVATRTGGIPFQVQDGEQGYLVERGDVPGLTKTLTILLKDGVKAREMGLKAREKAKGFQYPNLAASLLSVYEEVVQADGN